MEWECHECGHHHSSLPEACERCGTRPEIVLNVWRCQHCGEQDIPSSASRCPACGADRGLGVETAVAPGQRIEGEVARKLASGDWLYCAYCDVQVPPVDEQGNPVGECPTCKGPLSEATTMAAEEEVDAADAGQYRKEATRRKGEPLHRPAPPKKKRTALYIALGLVGAALLGVVLYFVLRGPDRLQVTARAWTCNLEVEKHGPVQDEGWIETVPAGARDRTCSRQIHHHDKVPAGTETYTDRVASGRTCASYGYRKKGGTSVKTCKRWETKYRTVTKTRTRYRRVPVYRQRCRYTVDRWHTARTLTASGTGEQEPAWPAADGLASRERAGKRSGVFTLELKGEDGARSYTCGTLEEWKRYPKGTAVLAETAIGGKIKSIRPAK